MNSPFSLAMRCYSYCMSKPKFRHFQMPKQLLSQLAECSNGFFLVVVNDKGKFETYTKVDSEVQDFGMANFLAAYSDWWQEDLYNPQASDGDKEASEGED